MESRGKVVYVQRLIQPSCKPSRNRIYSRLFDGRNECDEEDQLDGLPERNRRSAPAQQRDAA